MKTAATVWFMAALFVAVSSKSLPRNRQPIAFKEEAGKVSRKYEKRIYSYKGLRPRRSDPEELDVELAISLRLRPPCPEGSETPTMSCQCLGSGVDCKVERCTGSDRRYSCDGGITLEDREYRVGLEKQPLNHPTDFFTVGDPKIRRTT